MPATFFENLKKKKIDKLIRIRGEICMGCRAFISIVNNETKICPAPHKIKGGHCPCSSCLIKGMCTNACIKFTNYIFGKK
jgi:hypothetical protein